MICAVFKGDVCFHLDEKTQAEKHAVEVLNEHLEVLDNEIKELLKLLQVYELRVIGDEEEEHHDEDHHSYNVLHQAGQVAHEMEEQEEEEETEQRRKRDGKQIQVTF